MGIKIGNDDDVDVIDVEDDATEDEIARGDFIPDQDESEGDEDEEVVEGEEEEEVVEDESEEEEDAEEDDSEEPQEVPDEADEYDEGDEEYEDDGGDDPRIPLSRLNQVIGQREEAAKRAEWLESQLEKLLDKQLESEEVRNEVPEYDYAAAEAKYVELILEGETAKATAIRTEIDNTRQAEFKALIEQTAEAASETSTTASKAALEESRFESLRENYENKHAFLDAESDDYNEEAVDTVNTLMTGYLASGESKSAALKKAVAKAAPMYRKAGKAAPKRTEVTEKRKVKQRKKNVKAAKAQPPELKGKGTKATETGEVNVKSLSDKQYNSLTKKEKAILRGDIVG